MFSQSFRFMATALAATAILLLAAEPGSAQHRVSRSAHYGGISHGYGGYAGYSHYGYYPSHYGYYPSYSHLRFGYYPSYYYSGLAYPGYYAYPGYGYGYSTYSPAVSSYQAFYPPSLPRQTDMTAQISIRVPPDAEVWFEGKPTTQSGSLREFVSPPLTGGYEYTYTIRARWMDGNREVVQARSVSVQPGVRVSVDFTAPPPIEKVQSPRRSTP